MKERKKFGRMLQLNKETIGTLRSEHTREVVGGAGTYGTCLSDKATKCDVTQCLVCPCEIQVTPPFTFDCTMFCC
jgi:hypothetical protein